MTKLRSSEVVIMERLHEVGQSNVAIAHTLGVTEGAVRYRLKHEGEPDGRGEQVAKAAAFAPAIAEFMRRAAESPREWNKRMLFNDLCERGYTGSYSKLTGWMRKRYPAAPVQPVRRVETPPGAQVQADWLETSFFFEDSQSERKIYGLLLTLSHSRGKALVWRESMDLPSWLQGHNECYLRLGGIPAIERIDNLKTGVASGAGPWARLQPAFKAYARDLGFHVEACRPRTPTDKGKVERNVRTVRALGLPFSVRNLAHLQAETDRKIGLLMERLTCSATGKTVAQSLADERMLLRPLPERMPMAFDAVAVRPVSRDCHIHFLGRQYHVPFIHIGRRVEARGCADGKVRIYLDGNQIAEHERSPARRIVSNPAYWEGKGTDRVLPPVPLGRVGRLLAGLAADGVQHRSVDIYARLTEVLSCAR
jgi:transposase